ncbi:MAG: hypothetical protein RMM10_12370 [Anaerolineae bacterium]|uniref:hypothetical protein n=1 Tax=Thermoflexus sp. TaxID=1969742 RepID=UPI0025F5C683|nr:hypothetical protein [Thermoflexus sp.]MCS7352293.1 hypothetical protein [Thermoflexus sp.]MDW8181756.1 hypothetical protein [Anaerolineae bacterium]
MPEILMRDILPSLKFYQVRVSRRVEDVLPWMEALAARGAEFWTADEKRPVPRAEWADLVRTWMQKQWGIPARWSVPLGLRFEDLPEVFFRFSIDQFNDKENQVYLGTLLDFEFRDDRHLVEPVGRRLVELSLLLYPLLQPQRGDIEHWTPLGPGVVRRRRLKHISWVNIFGPGYVAEYGREFLRGLPGYRTEELGDGGVFHQLTPMLAARTEAEARGVRKAVISYCRRHGYRVTCWAPYGIPGLTEMGVGEGKMGDAELVAYLERLFGVTLVLKDGTRVKYLHLPWGELGARQRRLVVRWLRRAVEGEVKRGLRGRLRLEFSELPGEVARMLAEAFGEGNLAVEWAEVPLEEIEGKSEQE